MNLFLDILQVGGMIVFYIAAYLVLYTGWIWILAKICGIPWKEEWKWW